jgi:hypothetical protein
MDQWLWFNKNRRLVHCAPVDPVHGTVDIFHRFSFRKIIRINLENIRTPEILQNHPKLFQNFVLVPIILY